MLAYHHIASAANPELRHLLHKVNEERAAVVYAAWKKSTGALGGFFHGLVERVRQARRVKQTYRALSALSDHQLRDIGLTRGEVAGIAQAIATVEPATELTIAELRRARLDDDAESEARSAALPRQDNRARRPDASTARQPAHAFTGSDKATA